VLGGAPGLRRSSTENIDEFLGFMGRDLPRFTLCSDVTIGSCVQSMCIACIEVYMLYSRIASAGSPPPALGAGVSIGLN
jgi:hypothetical protein